MVKLKWKVPLLILGIILFYLLIGDGSETIMLTVIVIYMETITSIFNKKLKETQELLKYYIRSASKFK